MNAQPLGAIAFGDFEFDPASGELRRGDSVNRLAPQSAGLLALLVRRRGEVVTRGELRDALWPDTNVEFDQGLNFCIRQLRVALSDDAAAPKYIETLHRRGYRFIAPVRTGGAPRSVPLPVTNRAKRWPVIAGAILVALLAVVLFMRRQPSDPRLAILMFDVEPNDSAALVYYRFRMSEALLAASGRGQFEKIAVMGPSYTIGFPGMSTPPDSLRANLGATHILSGGLERDGDTTRVFAQLIRTSDRRHIYAARFFFDASHGSQITTIADSIARAVTTILAREHL